MMKPIHLFSSLLFLLLSFGCQEPKQQEPQSLRSVFSNPPDEAHPWVFWYWMRAAVSAEGITADLEAMKEAGIAGAYLMPLKNASNPPLFEPVMVQLTPEWWEMVKHAFNEADRLGLKLAIHACDGFALSGGPWITPELSMQKVVWADTTIKGGSKQTLQLPQPGIKENFYRDIALFAYPSPEGSQFDTQTTIPVITSSNGNNASALINPTNQDTFRSDEPCWIQYQFEEPFTCRSIQVGSKGNNFQSQRLLVEVSNDGQNFTSLGRLEPPRHGWQDTDAPYTHAIEPVTAKYFRFHFNPEGTEPGAEDLDAAKWRPNLRLLYLGLSGRPKIHHYEGKNASVWRVAPPTTEKQVESGLCIDPKKIINLTHLIKADGTIEWTVPKDNWTLLRMGHTSTGHTNYTGGGGLGLEVDKFNPEAVKFQFDQWFGKAVEMAGKDLASKVLTVFHVDSWECGSQNWTPRFAQEFKKRRGYDLIPFLPVMAGIPITCASESEKILKDIRTTIVELTQENFYQVYHKKVKEMDIRFSAECVAPTMTSDGMLHYGIVDIPMGEFWFRSPTHDKPNDALDAISGAHVYGKNIIQAECFTELRMAWDEHPGMLKTLGDRNFALGFNKYVFHIFTQNPWMDRKPGMTLDPIGLYFQRDQTWWKPGKAWVDYLTRCQALLQQGQPVTDIAVFTGEEIPRRAVLPERLVPFLPGIFGTEKVEAEKKRLKNEGLPIREMPRGVFHSANISDPKDWVDPLNGYTYDSFNPDALLRLAKVENQRIVLPGRASYGLLLLPGAHPMNPNGNQLSGAVAEKIYDLVADGAKILFSEPPTPVKDDKKSIRFVNKLLKGESFSCSDDQGNSISGFNIKRGKVLIGSYHFPDFKELEIEPDFLAFESEGTRARDLAWSHRKSATADIYFVSNQIELDRTLSFSFRIKGRIPELFDPVTGEITTANQWKISDDRTSLTLKLPANGSLFVVFEEKTNKKSQNDGTNRIETDTLMTLTGPWQIAFDSTSGGPTHPVITNELKSWTTFSEPGIKHYSGTAAYNKTFLLEEKPQQRVWIDLGRVANIASVKLNGTYCGVAWTFPFRVEVTKVLLEGSNQLEVEITNTWANRLIGDQQLPETERITWTTAPYMLEGKPLLDAGLLGEVSLVKQTE